MDHTVSQLAQARLYSIFGRPGLHREDGEMSQEQALAIVGIRTSLHVAAGCKMASTLSASHMRMCVGVSYDRDSVYTFQAASSRSCICTTESAVRWVARRTLRSFILLMAADRLALSQIKGNYQDRKKLMLENTDI